MHWEPIFNHLRDVPDNELRHVLAALLDRLELEVQRRHMPDAGVEYKVVGIVGDSRSGYCSTCDRDTTAPLFDGCMNRDCPKGFEPCL